MFLENYITRCAYILKQSTRNSAVVLTLVVFPGVSADAATFLGTGDPTLATVNIGTCTSEFTPSCGITKTVTSASEATPHTMEVALIGQTYFNLFEIVTNGTPAPITDYHITLQSIQIGETRGAFDSVSFFPTFPNSTVTTEISDFEASFDFVFSNPVDIGGIAEIDIFAFLTSPSGYVLEITQYPTFDTVTAVPVPGSLGLMGLGMFGLALAGRRKHRQSAFKSPCM